MKLSCCILCESENLVFSHKVLYKNKDYNYVLCKNCNITFQNPWPGLEIQDIYNDHDYWNSSNVYNDNHEGDNKNTYAVYQHSRFKEARNRYKKLSKHFKKLSENRSILEIGCANGIFLNEWHKNGWKCFGIDPAKEMIEYGKKNFGLNLKSETWEETQVKEKYFDCIYMWGTDSNFYNFKNGFDKISETLKDDGIFAMTYQDFKHPIRKIFKNIKMQPNALYNFSKKSIIFLMEKLNFKILNHSMTWQNTKLSHIKKIFGVNTSGFDFEIKVPALSYNMIIAKKIKKT